MKKDTLRIVTYNVWHGLSGEGLLRFGELEPKGRKQSRIDWQVRQLKKLAPDILFLQEVNPLTRLSRFYADALGLKEFHQLDQAGVELMGYGFPNNLKTGLVTLAAPFLRPLRVGGFRLSGPKLGWLTESFSFQLSEFRYALLTRIYRGDKPYLLINVHLHHGPALSKDDNSELNKLVDQGLVSPQDARSVREQMERSFRRRQTEIGKIADLIEAHSGISENIILAGDFNTSGSELDLLEKLDLVNVTMSKVREPSWDPETNAANHDFSRKMGLPVSDRGNPNLAEFIKSCVHSPNMLDHIFVTRSLVPKLVSAKRVLDEASDSGLYGSDHFGLVIELR